MHKNLIVLLIIVIIGFITFSSSLKNEFLMDDHGFFNAQNANINKAWQYFLPDRNKILGIESSKTDRSYYRPLAHFIPTVCYTFFKDNTIGYHTVNLLLFCGASFLLYILLLLAFNAPWVAFTASVFYLVHPINGIIVNYNTASVFAAQAIFMLASIIFVLKKSPVYLPVGLFVMALLCHESAMALPVFAFVFVLFASKDNWRHAFKATGPLWITLIVYFLFRLKFSSLSNSLFYSLSQAHVGWLEYLATVVKLAGWYIAKLFIPIGIVFMWVTPAVVNPWGLLLALLGSMVLIVGLMIVIKRPLLRIGLAWLSLGFVPLILGAVVSFRQGFLIEPHWFVFSSIGFFLIVADVADIISARLPRMIVWIFLALIGCGWIGASWVYNHLWSTEKGYCLYWKAYAPNFKAPSYFLANGYEKEGDYTAARKLYEESLLKRYKDWLVYVNLGQISLKQGNLEQAEEDFKAALSLESRSVEALVGMGIVYFRQNEYEFAKTFFEDASNVDRFSPLPYLQLAMLAHVQGDVVQAEKNYLEILKISPNNDLATVPLLRIYIASKDQERAVSMALLITQHSKNPTALTMAGSTLSFYNMPKPAAVALQKAISIAPEFKDAYIEAYKMYMKTGDTQQAGRMREKIQTLPNPLFNKREGNDDG